MSLWRQSTYLIEEDLADVRGVGSLVATEKGTVGTNDGVIGVVGEDVNVGSTTSVVTWDDRLELSNTVDVGLLDTTEEGRIEVASVILVAVARCKDTGVHTSGVACETIRLITIVRLGFPLTVPCIHVDGWNRLAGRCVDDLDVQEQRNTSLTFGHITANELAVDIVRSLSDLWLQDTAGIVVEELSIIRAQGDSLVRCVGDVVCGEVAGDKLRQIPLDTSLVSHGLAASDGILEVTTLAELGCTVAD